MSDDRFQLRSAVNDGDGLGYTVVPLTVRMGEKEYANYLDGREITP
jgi:hypothetical protein